MESYNWKAKPISPCLGAHEAHPNLPREVALRDLASRYFRRQGYSALRVESEPISALFGVFMSPLIQVVSRHRNAGVHDDAIIAFLLFCLEIYKAEQQRRRKLH